MKKNGGKIQDSFQNKQKQKLSRKKNSQYSKLLRINDASRKKKDVLILQPHVVNTTQKAIRDMTWEVFLRSKYFREKLLSVYCSFLSGS